MVKRAPVSRANTCAAPKDGGQWQRDVAGGQDTEEIVAETGEVRRPAAGASEEAQLKGKSCILLVPACTGQAVDPAAMPAPTAGPPGPACPTACLRGHNSWYRPRWRWGLRGGGH